MYGGLPVNALQAMGLSPLLYGINVNQLIGESLRRSL